MPIPSHLLSLLNYYNTLENNTKVSHNPVQLPLPLPSIRETTIAEDTRPINGPDISSRISWRGKLIPGLSSLDDSNSATTLATGSTSLNLNLILEVNQFKKLHEEIHGIVDMDVLKRRLFVSQSAIGLMKAGLDRIYGETGTSNTRLVSSSVGQQREMRIVGFIDGVFGWAKGGTGAVGHLQAEMRNTEELSTISINTRNQILRLCQVIIDHYDSLKEKDKDLTDEQMTERLNSHLEVKLSIEQFKDILACRIEQLTVERLRTIIENSNLLTKSEVDDILQEENNIEILQRARVRLQDEVNILRLKLVDKTKKLESETKKSKSPEESLPASLPTQEDREQLKSFLTNYRNIVEKVNTNQKDSIEIQNNEPEYEAKIEQLITKIDNWR